MSPIKCLTTQELNAFLANQLPAEAREGAEAHLSRCRPCRQRLASQYEDSGAQEITERAPYWLKARARRMPQKSWMGVPSGLLRFRHQITVALAAVVLVVLSLTTWRFWSPNERGAVKRVSVVQDASAPAPAGRPPEPKRLEEISPPKQKTAERPLAAQSPDRFDRASDAARDVSKSASARALPETRNKKEIVDQLRPGASSESDKARAVAREPARAEAKDAQEIAPPISSADKADLAREAPQPLAAKLPSDFRRDSRSQGATYNQPAAGAAPLPRDLEKEHLNVAPRQKAAGALAGRPPSPGRAVPVNAPVTEPQISPALQQLAPQADTAIVSDPIEFRWSQVPSASRYTFTLLDEKGAVALQTTTKEDRLNVSLAPLRVAQGKPYFWYIQATLPNGTTVESPKSKVVFHNDPDKK